MINPSPWVGSDVGAGEDLLGCIARSWVAFCLLNSSKKYIISCSPTPRSPYSRVNYFMNISRARQSIANRWFLPFPICIRGSTWKASCSWECEPNNKDCHSGALWTLRFLRRNIKLMATQNIKLPIARISSLAWSGWRALMFSKNNHFPLNFDQTNQFGAIDLLCGWMKKDYYFFLGSILLVS